MNAGLSPRPPSRQGRVHKGILLTVLVPILALCIACSTHAAPTGVVEIKSLAVNYDSVKVDFAPVAGAKDYRIYEASDPRDVKYAGIWHLNAPYNSHFVVDNTGQPVFPLKVEQNGNGRGGPGHVDIPALEVEWNGLQPRMPTTLVVEAVNQVGPVPPANCTARAATGTIRGTMDSSGHYIVMPTYGSNAGPVAAIGQDVSNFATNGQGSPSDHPVAIARSRPFVVTATGHPPLPSTDGATQVFFDSFPNEEQTAIRRLGPVDVETGREKFVMGHWILQYVAADLLDSYPFVMNNHFMDVLFDGGTPGSNIPPHNNKSLMTMSPDKFADFSGGRVLHLTMEVDAHTDARRWVGFNLSPADDPLQNWYVSDQVPVNKTDQGFFVEILGNVISTNYYAGRRPDGSDLHFSIAAAAGQATYSGYRNESDYQFGRGLDNRSRFDLFISEKHFAIFEDGRKVYDYNLPKPLPFTKARVYFTHYVYHTGNEINELRQGSPFETFWIQDMPWSDERHWDNMGFEVLPAEMASDWNSLGSLAKLPDASAPNYVAEGSGKLRRQALAK